MKVEKPIIGKRTMLGQAYDEFIGSMDMPITDWCNKKKMSKGK